MSFGRDIAAGVSGQIANLLLIAVVAGAALGLGLYFGGAWVITHVAVVIH